MRAAWMPVFVLLLTAAAVAGAEETVPPLGVGDVIPELTLQDQHGAQRVVDGRVRVILFSRDMDGGDVLKAGLADLPEGTLEAAGAAYVSDISGMPRIIARMFALPSMRRRPYAMLLDRTGEATAFLPDLPGRATLIHLERLQIVRIEYYEDPESVREGVLELARTRAGEPGEAGPGPGAAPSTGGPAEAP